MKIFKYRLEIRDEQTLMLPRFGEILHVGVQDSQLCIWVWVDEHDSLDPHLFAVIGTGNPIPEYDTMEHLGTVQQEGFVRHVFLVTKYKPLYIRFPEGE